MNDQPPRRVNHIKPSLFSLWPQSLEILRHYHKHPPSIFPDKMTGKHVLHVWILFYVGDWYHSLLILPRRPCFFSDSLRISGLYRSFTVMFFLWWYWDSNSTPRRKLNRFGHTGRYRFLSLSVIISIILVCARFHSLVLSRISKLQAKQYMGFESIMTWSNDSFHHWCISKTQYLVLL